MPEIRSRVTAANRCFFGLKGYLKSDFISRKTKILIYKSLIRPILTYSAETWAMTEKVKDIISVFERKILRSIFGGLKCNNIWRRRTNSKLYKSLKEPDIVKYITIQRIKWVGHLCRMAESRTTKKIFSARPFGTRKRGRPKLRWLDCVEKDFKILRVTNWRSLARDRRAWNSVLRKAKAYPGLSGH